MRLPRVRFTSRWVMVAVAVVAWTIAGVGLVVLLTLTGTELSQTDEFPLLAVARTDTSQTDERSLLIEKQTQPLSVDEHRTLCGKTLDEWISDLRTKPASERSEAAWALTYFGPAAKAAVPDLLEIMRIHKDDELQLNSVEALGRIGPDAAPAVPLLIKRLINQHCLLGEGGVIIERVEGNPKYALARIGGPAVLALIAVLNGPDAETRPCAVEILAMIGRPSKVAVPALTRLLREGSVTQRYAARALGRIGPDATQAVPDLYSLLCLKREDSLFKNLPRYESWEIVNAMARIGVLPIPKLVDVFLNEGSSAAAYDLSMLGPMASSAVPPLQRALNDPRPDVRIQAAIALAFIDPSIPEALTVLIDAFERHPSDALEVPLALARLGPHAKSALPRLFRLVEKGETPRGLVQALFRIDPEGQQCVPALIAALKHRDSYVVEASAECLGLLGPRAAASVPALTELATGGFHEPFANSNPRRSAAKALRRIGSAARPSIPALVAALKAQPGQLDDETTRAIVETLGSFGAESKSAVGILIDILKNRERYGEQYYIGVKEWSVRTAAALALGQIGPDAEVAVPILREAMNEFPARLRVPMIQVSDAAVIALLSLAPDGKEVAEKWVQSSRSPERRACVVAALGRTSLEGDAVTRMWLESVDDLVDGLDDRSEFHIRSMELYFERLGLLGVGGRVAAPRLNGLKRHANPWVRQWAGEALARIMRSDSNSSMRPGTTGL
jgi:HEAT repeat protein